MRSFTYVTRDIWSVIVIIVLLILWSLLILIFKVLKPIVLVVPKVTLLVIVIIIIFEDVIAEGVAIVTPAKSITLMVIEITIIIVIEVIAFITKIIVIRFLLYRAEKQVGARHVAHAFQVLIAVRVKAKQGILLSIELFLQILRQATVFLEKDATPETLNSLI